MLMNQLNKKAIINAIIRFPNQEKIGQVAPFRHSHPSSDHGKGNPYAFVVQNSWASFLIECVNKNMAAAIAKASKTVLIRVFVIETFLNIC